MVLLNVFWWYNYYYKHQRYRNLFCHFFYPGGPPHTFSGKGKGEGRRGKGKADYYIAPPSQCSTFREPPSASAPCICPVRHVGKSAFIELKTYTDTKKGILTTLKTPKATVINRYSGSTKQRFYNILHRYQTFLMVLQLRDVNFQWEMKWINKWTWKALISPLKFPFARQIAVFWFQEMLYFLQLLTFLFHTTTDSLKEREDLSLEQKCLKRTRIASLVKKGTIKTEEITQ